MTSDIIQKAELKVRYGDEIRRASLPRTKMSEETGVKKVINGILDAIGL